MPALKKRSRLTRGKKLLTVAGIGLGLMGGAVGTTYIELQKVRAENAKTRARMYAETMRSQLREESLMNAEKLRQQKKEKNARKFVQEMRKAKHSLGILFAQFLDISQVVAIIEDPRVRALLTSNSLQMIEKRKNLIGEFEKSLGPYERMMRRSNEPTIVQRTMRATARGAIQGIILYEVNKTAREK